jgi:hypothetical protein
LSSGKEVPNLAGQSDQAISCLGNAQRENVLKYVRDKTSSPGVVTGKWLLKN